MKYAFVLGRNRDLSLAEIASIFDAKCVGELGETAVFEMEKLENPQASLDRMGGSMKIIEIFAEGVYDTAIALMSDYLANQKRSKQPYGPPGGTKLIFGLNILNADSVTVQKTLKHFLLNLKRSLKGDGKVRFVNKNFQNVSEVFAKKQRLIEEGVELNCISAGRGKGNILFGRTVAIQDFEGYGERDYGKPARDARVGMLPPKLTQMMINLAQPQKDTVIYDPFCGTGTVMMEALMMGHDVMGSDLNPEMTNASQKNIEWLKNKFGIKNACRIFQKDATAITREDILPKDIAIVTEPLLGPPLSKSPTLQEAERIVGTLASLYLKFFENLKKIAPAGMRVVFIFPYIKGAKQIWHSSTFEELDKKIESLGFKALQFPGAAHRDYLTYDRENQLVGREIREFMYQP